MGHETLSFVVSYPLLDLHLDRQPSEILSFSLRSYCASWYISGCYYFDQTNRYFLYSLQPPFYFTLFMTWKHPYYHEMVWMLLQRAFWGATWNTDTVWSHPLYLSYCHQHPQEKKAARESRITWELTWDYRLISNEQSELPGNPPAEFPGELLSTMRSDPYSCISLPTFLPIFSLSLGPFCIVCITSTIIPEQSSSLLSFSLWFETRSNNLQLAFHSLFPSQERRFPFTSLSLSHMYTYENLLQ